MLGTLVNTAAIVLGTIIGLFFGNRIPQRMSDSIIKGFGLIVVYMGVGGALKSQNPYIMIFSMVIGTAIGEAFSFHDKLENMGARLRASVEKRGTSADKISDAFITATLLFCTGAMAIIGALDAGIKGDYTMLYTKSTLDFISSIVLASSLGYGVGISAVSILVYQGLITLLSSIMAPILSPEVVLEMGAIGSVLLLGLGFNILETTRLKLMNYIPSVFVPIILYPLYHIVMNLMHGPR